MSTISRRVNESIVRRYIQAIKPKPVMIIYYANVVIDLPLGAGFGLTLSADKSSMDEGWKQKSEIFCLNQFNDNEASL